MHVFYIFVQIVPYIDSPTSTLSNVHAVAVFEWSWVSVESHISESCGYQLMTFFQIVTGVSSLQVRLINWVKIWLYIYQFKCSIEIFLRFYRPLLTRHITTTIESACMSDGKCYSFLKTSVSILNTKSFLSLCVPCGFSENICF